MSLWFTGPGGSLVQVVRHLFCVYPDFKWLLVPNSHVAELVVRLAAERAVLFIVVHNGSTFCGISL